MNIHVVNESTEEITRHATRDKWDRDDTRQSHDIQGIQIVPKKAYYDLTVSFDVVPDKSYYLIYVLYGTGDSFGHDENRIAFIELFQDKAKAKALKKLIEDNHAEVHDKDGLSFTDSYTMKYLNEQGTEIVLQKNWEGYFESFNGCKVQEVELIEGED